MSYSSRPNSKNMCNCCSKFGTPQLEKTANRQTHDSKNGCILQHPGPKYQPNTWYAIGKTLMKKV